MSRGIGLRPFRRRAPATDRAAPASVAAAAAAVGAADGGAGPVIARAAETRPEWRDVPAMGTSFGPPELTVAPDSFRAGLAAHTPPQPFLAPLGHLVSADGPSGIVSGLAQPLVTVARSVAVGAEEAPLPVRRSASASASRAGVVQRWPARNRWGSPMVTASSVEVPPLVFEAV